MRTLVLLGWLMVPVVFGAYHYGPGQERLRLDDAARVLAEADRLAAASEWQAAVTKYDEAQALLPEGRVDDVRRIRLKRAKMQMFARQLPEANAALRDLVDQMQDDKTSNPALRDEAREALANVQYYMTWLMRLEGLGADEWEPEIESARQTYRLLAEQAEAARDPKSAAQAPRGSRKRNPARASRRRRVARTRDPHPVPGMQERPVQETRQAARQEIGQGRREERRPQRRRRPAARQLRILSTKQSTAMHARCQSAALLLAALSVIAIGTAAGQAPRPPSGVPQGAPGPLPARTAKAATVKSTAAAELPAQVFRQCRREPNQGRRPSRGQEAGAATEDPPTDVRPASHDDPESVVHPQGRCHQERPGRGVSGGCGGSAAGQGCAAGR